MYPHPSLYLSSNCLSFSFYLTIFLSIKIVILSFYKLIQILWMYFREFIYYCFKNSSFEQFEKGIKDRISNFYLSSLRSTKQKEQQQQQQEEGNSNSSNNNNIRRGRRNPANNDNPANNNANSNQQQQQQQLLQQQYQYQHFDLSCRGVPIRCAEDLATLERDSVVEVTGLLFPSL